MQTLKRKIKTAQQLWNENGLKGIKTRIADKYLGFNRNTYQKWIRQFDKITENDYQLIQTQIKSFSYQPLISIVLPVYNIEEKWLRLCIESVCNQIYQNWELCIADDCSPNPRVREVLTEYQAKDSRIKVVFRETNGHISVASNSALEMATGVFSVLLDHDDELSEHALYFVVRELNLFPETQMIYSDEDLIDEKGRRSNPKFKPDWSLDLFYSLNLITHLSAYKTELLKEIGGFRLGSEGSQDYDLAFRVIEQIDESQIRHIPHILYHWRAVRGSLALDLNEKPYAHERARDVIRQHFQRIGLNAKVEEGYSPLHRVVYNSQPSYEIIKPINPTATSFNSLAKNSQSDVLVFVDASIKTTQEESLLELVKIASQKNIGAVGGKILDKTGLVQNGGIILEPTKLVVFAHRGFSDLSTGGFIRAQVINNFSAVSGVLAIKRELFEKVNGFDEKNFNQGLYEIDLCLRLWEMGLRIVFTPYAKFIQEESSALENILKTDDSKEIPFFKEKWQSWVKRDRFYNENLSFENGGFGIQIPPRIKKPWQI